MATARVQWKTKALGETGVRDLGAVLAGAPAGVTVRMSTLRTPPRLEGARDPFSMNLGHLVPGETFTALEFMGEQDAIDDVLARIGRLSLPAPTPA